MYYVAFDVKPVFFCKRILCFFNQFLFLVNKIRIVNNLSAFCAYKMVVVRTMK